jgi:hypothetical protein
MQTEAEIINTGRIVWYPPKTRREIEFVLSRIIQAAREDKLTIWGQEIDGVICYVITPAHLLTRT